VIEGERMPYGGKGWSNEEREGLIVFKLGLRGCAVTSKGCAIWKSVFGFFLKNN
jgi:hypothetical protein